MKTPLMVSPEEWSAARERLLVKEKELTRARDALAAERRRMPWLEVDKEYWFEGPDGRVSLAGLFEGRRQLIVYRAFYGTEVTTYAEGGSYPERACVGCSFGADQVAHPGHLHARNTTLAFASRAPQADRGVSVISVASGRQANLTGAQGEVPRPAETYSQAVLPPSGEIGGCSDRPLTRARSMPQLVVSAP